MKSEIIRLELMNSLYYDPTNVNPFDYQPGNGEMCFCFCLDESVYAEFEPDISFFPGIMVKNDEKSMLPMGKYLFSQAPAVLNREEIINLAVEVQKEALWQRLKPDKRYFLRYVSEDNRTVTQIFRAYTEPEL